MFLSSIFPQDDNKFENMNKITNVSKFKHANNPKEQHTFQMYQCLDYFHIFCQLFYYVSVLLILNFVLHRESSYFSIVHP